jgi:hypothetical protein
MSLISRTADLYYTFRFLKLLVTPWKETDAFKHGIVDAEGRVIKKASELKTSEEKSAYTTFHRLVFNIKRLLEKVPFGKSRIASYAAALYLIKEETGMSDAGLVRLFERVEGVEFDNTISENAWFLNSEGALQPGTYTLRRDCPIVLTAEFRAYQGGKIDIPEALKPVSTVLGNPVFIATHRETKQKIAISLEDITR